MPDTHEGYKHTRGCLETSARAGDEGKLFGSVTSAQVAELIVGHGFDIDKRRVSVDAIKSIGEHTVEVKLHRDVIAKVKLLVKPEGAPAAAPDQDVYDPDDHPAPEDTHEGGDEDDDE